MQRSKINWFIFLCIVIFFISTSAQANENLLTQSKILRTGNLQLTETQPLTLEDELIFIKLDGDYINMFIRYKYKNNGTARNVTFGFPIDFLYYTDQPLSESIENFHVKDEYNTEYEYREVTDDATDIFSAEQDEHTAYRKWLMVEIPFPAKTEKHLTMTYRIKVFTEDIESYFSYFPNFSDRTFQFGLELGKLDSSIVKKFQLIIDTHEDSHTDKDSIKINLPNILQYHDILTYTANNFDLSTQPELELIYKNNTALLTQFTQQNRAPSECILNIQSSSTYKSNYPAMHVLDGNLDSAWLEGATDGGVGEWIEVELINFQLFAITMINGYTKNPTTYTLNPKIKKLKIELEYIDHVSSKTLPQTKEYIVELTPHEYADLNKQYFSTFMDVLLDFGDNYHIAKKIRFIILEVEPGTKYTETGFTELYLLGKRILDSEIIIP